MRTVAYVTVVALAFPAALHYWLEVFLFSRDLLDWRR